MTTSRAATLLKGLGALVALMVAVVGVPILLQAVAGSPTPSAMPAWDEIWGSFTRRDDGSLLLGLLKYAAWAGWALFVLSVLADVVTRLRGLPAPRLGPQQQLVTQLVGAVLAIAASVPTALPATATPVQQSSLSQPAAASTVQLGVPVATHPVGAKDTSDEEPYEEYRVRRGDCLWDIAWNELGEPERWPEIFEASRSVPQSDGRRLTDPDLIVTGWVLHIPDHDAEQGSANAQQRAPQTSTRWREGAPPRKNEAVVTPLRSPSFIDSATPWGQGGAQPGHPAARVTSPFSTPRAGTGNRSTALELRWTALLSVHDHATRHRDWRTSLNPKNPT